MRFRSRAPSIKAAIRRLRKLAREVFLIASGHFLGSLAFAVLQVLLTVPHT
jgi:hypothetical protein